MSGDTGQRLAGRCACGAVTFTATPKSGMGACHCETCRRMSGGVFLSVECEDDIEAGGPLMTWDSSEWAFRQFCGTCGSTLFWRMKAGGMTSVSVQAFDDPGAFAFESEIYIDSKPASYAFAGERTRMTKAEVEALYAPPPEGA